MRQFALYFIIIVINSSFILKGNSRANDTSEVLEKLFSRLSISIDDNVRLRINDSIRIMIDSYVRSDTIFKHRFTNLKFLGQITSADSLLKIVTWNLVLANTPGRYYCYFIRKGENGRANRVHSLINDYRAEKIMTDTTYIMSDWYGALYYDMKSYIIDNKRFWILLGVDYGNTEITRKIIDVLSFNSDSTLLFGRKWFESGDKIQFREVFEYASNGIMTLRFTSDSSIVFDHLVPFNPSQKDEHQFYGPEYSYDAYHFDKGIWRLSINVDVRNRE